MEKIIRIEEVTFKRKRPKNDYESFDGFQIITDKQTIKLGINNDQNCCESWGFFMTNEDYTEFEGANLIEISMTDTSLNTKTLEDLNLNLDSGFEEVCLMFVNLNTSEGILQFTAYNQHNGYYGHEAVVISEQLNCEVGL